MRYILFTTTQCPKCPTMKEFAKTLDIDGVIYDETHAQFMELVMAHDATVAPTMIILNGRDEIGRGNTPEEIKEILDGVQ